MVNKFLFCIFFILLFFPIISTDSSLEIFLEQGKNFIEFNSTSLFYVEDLIKLNPEIKAVSFVEKNKSRGYINFMGGIGENFIIKKEVIYEVFMELNKTIILPN